MSDSIENIPSEDDFFTSSRGFTYHVPDEVELNGVVMSYEDMEKEISAIVDEWRQDQA